MNAYANRMQCPLEYVVIGALVAIAALVGRRIGIRPKRRDDWPVIPNLWGAVVGRPGSMKSPALAEVLRPLGRLETKAREVYEEQCKSFDQEFILAKSMSDAAEQSLKTLRNKKEGDDQTLRELAAQVAAVHGLKPPSQRRYSLNDTTIEKLGEILMVNTNGVLIFRDELIGFLRGLEKSGREQDRSFYLEGFNGNSSFTFDRIGRGTKFISAVCISILGGIQPGPLANYFEEVVNGGSEDDGFLSRFQLLVYPDDQGTWVNVDEWPDGPAKERAFEIYEKLDELDPGRIGAEFDEFSGQPYLRFSGDAQEFFDQWRHDLENDKLRSSGEDPRIVCHLSKYRSLMPKLALLFHLIDVVDGTASGPVSLASAGMAAGWCDFLETHARRIYDGFGDPATTSARKLASRIKKGDVPNPYSFSTVAQKGWSGLNSAAAVKLATDRLETLGWVYKKITPSTAKGGSPKTEVYINSKIQVDRR